MRLIDGDELYQKVVGYNGGAVDKTVAKRLIDQMPTIDAISRQAAIDAMMKLQAEDEELYACRIPEGFDGDRAKEALEQLPSAQPEVIYCMDCDWWTKQDDSVQGRCALMGAYPTGWWFCGNARRRTDE